jgi:hypothetical protein
MDNERARAFLAERVAGLKRPEDRWFVAGMLAGGAAMSRELAERELERRERAQRGAGEPQMPPPYGDPRGRSDAALRKRIDTAAAVRRAVEEMREAVPVAPPKFKRSVVERMKFKAACFAAGVEFVTIGDGGRRRPAFFSCKTRDQIEWSDVPESVRKFL